MKHTLLEMCSILSIPNGLKWDVLIYLLIASPQGVGDTLSIIGKAYFGVLKILNLSMFWGCQTNDYFLGFWKFFGKFLGVACKLDYFWGSFYYQHF